MRGGSANFFMDYSQFRGQASPLSPFYGQTRSVPMFNGQPLIPPGIRPTGITLYTPSISYTVPQGTASSFSLDWNPKSNSYTFTLEDPNGIRNPRFLFYIVSLDGIALAPLKVTINGRAFPHSIADKKPMDITQFVQCGQMANTLIIENKGFVSPFSIIGVWSSYTPLKEIVRDISTRGPFEEVISDDIDPISHQVIEIPARGSSCKHPQFFDLMNFVIQAQALHNWNCPICGAQVSLDSLVIGTHEAQPMNTAEPFEPMEFNDTEFWN